MIFTVLIMAGSFLFELTEYLSKGINPVLVAQLTLVLLPGIVAKTFPMAVLLAGLLSFGRLSSDSEIVAIKAAGVSVARIMVPVAAFGLVVALASFGINERLVPSATQQAVGLKKQFESELNGRTAQDVSKAVYQDNKLKASFWAKDFSFTNRTLKGVVITVYDEDENPTAYFHVNELEYTDEKNWAMRGGITMTAAQSIDSPKNEKEGKNQMFAKFDSAWPSGIPQLDATPEELLAKTLRDLDALPMEDMGKQIKKLRESPDQTPQLRAQIANLEFGYWNKVALPLAALVFGLVGAPLGIRSHRVPASAGFWQAVIIIFAYMLLANVMSISAQGGRVPAALASFLPIAIGLVVGAVLIRKRDN